HRARDLLSVLPPGTVGLSILLDPGVSNPTPADCSTSPGRRVDAGAGDVHELLAFAASGGWHACVVDGPQDIADAWARLVGGAAVT
ncbi:MAG: hypothetical protein Q4P32_11260, partial [Micrococcales bacterium]|nr:hypothetical protein [Micrococcales bacterium]